MKKLTKRLGAFAMTGLLLLGSSQGMLYAKAADEGDRREVEYTYEKLPQEPMKASATATSSKEPAQWNDGGAELAFDGQIDTAWHTNYGVDPMPTPPYHVTWSLGANGEAYNIGRIEYARKQRGNNGTWKDITVTATLADGTTAEVYTGILEEIAMGASTYIDFAPVEATKLDVEIQDTYNEDTSHVYASAGEINVYKATPVVVEHSHSVDGNGEAVTFTELPEEYTGGTLAAGNYYLTKDIALTEAMLVNNGTVNFCLGGHTITNMLDSEGYAGDYVIETEEGGIINLCDCTGTGQVRNLDAHPLATYAKTIFIHSGTVNLYSGRITSAAKGVSVSKSYEKSKGVINVYGGEILAEKGAALDVTEIANIYGGTVRSSNTDPTGDMNAISVNYGTISLSGGTVISDAGYGVKFVAGTKLNLSGAPVINGNKADVYVDRPELIDANGYTGERVTVEPEIDNELGVDDVLILNGTLDKFEIVKEGYEVKTDENGNLILGEATPSYTVTFQNGNDASGVKVPQNDPIGELFPEDPEKEGYVFLGWNTQSNGKGEFINNEYVPTGDVTVYAVFDSITKKATYTFIYYWEDEDNLFETRPKNVALPTFVDEKGEHKTVYGGTSMGTAIKGQGWKTTVKNVPVYYSSGEKVEWKMNWGGNGSYEVMKAEQTGEFEYTLTLGLTLRRADKTIRVNWENDTAESRRDITVQLMGQKSSIYGAKPVGEPVKLTAENNYTYTWEDMPEYVSHMAYAPYYPLYSIKEIDAIEGYETTYSSEKNKKDVYEFSAEGELVITNTKLPEEYTITFYIDGVATEVPVTEGIAIGDKIPETNKEGFEFLGWYTEENGGGTKVEVNAETTFTSDQTLYAHYKELLEEYTITFYIDGEATEVSVTEGIAIGDQIPDTAKEGYEFLGWYTEENGKGTKVEVDAETVFTADQTLYAYYQEIVVEYEIVFYVDGVPTTVKVKAGEPIGDLLPKSPTKEGYTFVEWNTKEDGSGDVVTSETAFTKDFTVYAIFKKDAVKPAEPGEKPDNKPDNKPDSKPDNKPNQQGAVQTGDTANFVVWIALVIAAGAGIISAVAIRKKNSRRKDSRRKRR